MQKAIGTYRVQLRERHGRMPYFRRVRGLRQMIYRDRDGARATREDPLHPGPRQRLAPIKPHSLTQ
ncbi:hypothetical protein GCM10009604_00460 [Corynebacterium aurimucosum]